MGVISSPGRALPGLCPEGADLQQDTLRRTEEDIGTRDGVRIADKAHASVGDFRDVVAEIDDFFFRDGLETEMARRNQFKCFHDINLS